MHRGPMGRWSMMVRGPCRGGKTGGRGVVYMQLAEALDKARPAILRAYEGRLAAEGSPLVSGQSVWSQAKDQADAIVTDVIDVLRGIDVDFASRAEMLSEIIG